MFSMRLEWVIGDCAPRPALQVVDDYHADPLTANFLGLSCDELKLRAQEISRRIVTGPGAFRS